MSRRTVTITRKGGDTAIAVFGIGAAICGATLALTCVAAWITHVIVCIKTSAWILLLFGCVVAPVGVIHGIGVWLGMF